MKKPHLPDIREIMRATPDGMTTNQLHKALPHIKRVNTIRKCLERMPDAYIDRWVINPGNRGQYEAVWCVVIPPKHCPHPTDRHSRQPKTQWVTAQT